MKVFVTGGTGFIGSAVVRELVRAGHDVTTLSRSAEKGEPLRREGADIVLGELGDPSTYKAAAAEADAIIHAAFDYAATVETDATAIETLIRAARTHEEGKEALALSLVYTSGCWVLGDTGGEPADESFPLHPAEIVEWRPAHERTVLEAAGNGLATAVIRPGMVYGGSGSVTAGLFLSAEEESASAYVGDGENRWSMVHREDLARLYRMILEARAPGVLHGVDGHPVRVREAARAASMAAGAGGATRSLPIEEARATMGPMADALVMDQWLVGRRSAELGWAPERASFVEEAASAYEELKATREE